MEDRPPNHWRDVLDASARSFFEHLISISKPFTYDGKGYRILKDVVAEVFRFRMSYETYKSQCRDKYPFIVPIGSGASTVYFLFEDWTLGAEFKNLQAYRELLHMPAVQFRELVRPHLKSNDDYPCIVGSSKAIDATQKLALIVAASDVPVLLLGETGTGKGLFAKLIHRTSKRRDARILTVNSAALQDTLVESELFGHERGAFTDAVQKKYGKFELATDGTLFLDEIGEVSLLTQAKILRAIDEGKFERVGGTTELKTNARFIAATNRNLYEMVRNGKFRADLFYRLNVFPIQVPALRERLEDIPELVDHFLLVSSQALDQKLQRLTPSALALFQSYHWPGNVRELGNVLMRACIMAGDREVLEACDFTQLLDPREKYVTELNAAGDFFDSTPLSMEEVERAHILRTLAYTRWNRRQAARILKVSLRGLQNKMKRYDLRSLEAASH